jgi:hypothetical protein
MRVREMAELQSLLDSDPVILAERGFSYETLPMLNAVVP